MVEKAPQFRTGGYAVDFRRAGSTVAEQMGILPDVREHGYVFREVRIVDARGRKVGGFSTDALLQSMKGRFTSLPRGDLAAAIYRTIENRVEALFGSSISAIDERATGVLVSFEHGVAREFDLVIGADGLHSTVRALAFGPEPQLEKQLGYRVAAFEKESPLHVQPYPTAAERAARTRAETSAKVGRRLTAVRLALPGQAFLGQLSAALPAGRHVLLGRNRAGYPVAKALRVPAHLALPRLPAYSPELSPVGRLGLYPRQHPWSNRADGDVAAVAGAAVAGWRAVCLARTRSGPPAASTCHPEGNSWDAHHLPAAAHFSLMNRQPRV